ncbi:galectin-3-like [Protopterus annectens]|uniref:galectin-3-like n=1 Tax=Protopterus annectens TaxID=7888 RepID=UPI001CF987B5|nr:galectin-3-like [Protopterus annectens]
MSDFELDDAITDTDAQNVNTNYPYMGIPVPYTLPLQVGILHGLEIQICGDVKPDAGRFTFDFRKGNDIAFHFNIRFDDSEGKVVVRNSCLGGHWGNEERDAPLFPFVQGQRFEVRIRSTDQNYQVTVNGQHFINYNHRIHELSEIKALYVHGDLLLHQVNPYMT